MNKANLTAYEVVTEENLTDIHSTGWLLRHKKTGARVMLIENDDENKVFNIAFRTPPKDSTGGTYPGAQCTLRFKGISIKGSFRRTGKGFSEYVPECHDLSG